MSGLARSADKQSDPDEWTRVHGAVDTSVVSVAALEAELRAAHVREAADADAEAYVRAQEGGASPGTSLAALLASLHGPVPCRALEQRVGLPTLRQAALVVALWRQLAAATAAQWVAPEVYFNAKACTLLPAPCLACVSTQSAPPLVRGARAAQAAPAAHHRRAFGMSRRRPCCLPLCIGDVLVVPQNAMVQHMAHPMVYVGGGMVTHLMRRQLPDGSTAGVVGTVPLLRQRGGSTLQVRVVSGVRGLPGAPARRSRVRRALSCTGAWAYDCLQANCEHFIADVCREPYASPALEQGACVVLPAALVLTLAVIWIIASVQEMLTSPTRGRGRGRKPKNDRSGIVHRTARDNGAG